MNYPTPPVAAHNDAPVARRGSFIVKENGISFVLSSALLCRVVSRRSLLKVA